MLLRQTQIKQIFTKINEVKESNIVNNIFSTHCLHNDSCVEEEAPLWKLKLSLFAETEFLCCHHKRTAELDDILYITVFSKYCE